MKVFRLFLIWIDVFPQSLEFYKLIQAFNLGGTLPCV